MEYRAFVVKDFVRSFSDASVAGTQSSEILCSFWDDIIVQFNDDSASMYFVNRDVKKTSGSDMSRLKTYSYQ